MRDDETLPDNAAEEVIAESDVVPISDTSIVGGTVDRFLQLSCNAKEVPMVGGAASIPPTVLFKHGATDVERVVRIIAEAGGASSFADAVEFVIHEPAPRTGE